MNKLLIIFLLLLGTLSVGLFWWSRGVSPVNRTDTTAKMFVIPKGTPLREIANSLKSQGIIRDSVVFFLLVKQMGLDTKIQAGDYRLSPSMNARDVASALTKGTVDIWVTIPEGKRAEEVGEILKKSLPSYDDSWTATLAAHEGYLFPDTYLIPKNAGIESITSLLKNTFAARFATFTTQQNLSQQEIVTIASLIEREAKTDAEKPIISGIIHNRLQLGIPLQIDATIQYAKGYNEYKRTWWDSVLSSEYQSVKSPYNTYLNPGLPPGPIANPGLEALKAAANPADTPYLYYLHDGNGQIHYGRDVTEHNANIRKYGL